MGARLPSLDTSGLDTAAAGYRASAQASIAKSERTIAALNRIGSTVGGAITRKQDIKRSDAIRADENARSDRRWQEELKFKSDAANLHRQEFAARMYDGGVRQAQDRLDEASSGNPDDPAVQQRIEAARQELADYSAKRSAMLDQFDKNTARPTTAMDAPPGGAQADPMWQSFLATDARVSKLDPRSPTYEKPGTSKPAPSIDDRQCKDGSCDVSKSKTGVTPTPVAPDYAKTGDPFREAVSRLADAQSAEFDAQKDYEEAKRSQASAKGQANKASWYVAVNAAHDKLQAAHRDAVFAKTNADGAAETHKTALATAEQQRQADFADTENAKDEVAALTFGADPAEWESTFGYSLDTSTPEGRRQIHETYKMQKEAHSAQNRREQIESDKAARADELTAGERIDLVQRLEAAGVDTTGFNDKKINDAVKEHLIKKSTSKEPLTDEQRAEYVSQLKPLGPKFANADKWRDEEIVNAIRENTIKAPHRDEMAASKERAADVREVGLLDREIKLMEQNNIDSEEVGSTAHTQYWKLRNRRDELQTKIKADGPDAGGGSLSEKVKAIEDDPSLTAEQKLQALDELEKSNAGSR